MAKVGFPDIRPLIVFKVIPSGNVPLVRLNEYGGVPPVTMSGNE